MKSTSVPHSPSSNSLTVASCAFRALAKPFCRYPPFLDGFGCLIILGFGGIVAADQLILAFLVFLLVLGDTGVFTDSGLHHVGKHLHFTHKPLALGFKLCRFADSLPHQP